MTKLEDCQLEFESLKREICIIASSFKQSVETKIKIQSIEKYLAEMLKKFENGGYYNEDPLAFPAIIEFTKQYKKEEKDNAPFFTQFVKPFDSIRKTLVEEISK